MLLLKRRPHAVVRRRQSNQNKTIASMINKQLRTRTIAMTNMGLHCRLMQVVLDLQYHPSKIFNTEMVGFDMSGDPQSSH